MRTNLELLSGALICALVLAATLLFEVQTARAGACGLSLKEIRENLYDVVLLSEDVRLLVGERGAIYRSSDGGKSWVQIESGSRENLFSASFSDEHNGWISGSGGLILRTTDGGLSWAKQNSVTRRDLFAIHFSDERHGIAVGDWGAAVRTEDGGVTWQDSSLNEDMVIYDVYLKDSMTGWIAGEFGKVFMTEDGGKTWRSLIQETATPCEPKTLFCMTENRGTLFVAGIDGTILYSRDEGKTWTQARNDSKGAIYGIKIKDDTGWAVGDMGTVLHSSDGGKSWTSIEVPQSFRLAWVGAVDIAKRSECSGVVVGARGLSLPIVDDKLQY